MPLLTVFTPSYNRKHTICRTYESLKRQTCKDFQWLIIDDGSSDGTRQWVETLGEKSSMEGTAFNWMGISKDEKTNDHFVIDADGLHIEYIYKPNGGLYTGYNVAYVTIQTELCVCIDSDDFMPDDAVEKIKNLWTKHYPSSSLITHRSSLTNVEYCGIEGLDYDINTNEPIGGYFPEELKDVYLHELYMKKIHCGDAKQVMRTDLMRGVAPQIGFKGEKNFNPIYLLLQVCDKYPLLVLNDNLCTVEYQIGADSMSQGIYKQYINSPRSFAKMRLLEFSLEHSNLKDKYRSAIHYVSSCIIAKDTDWFKNSPKKLLTLLAAPFGVLLYCLIKYKTR